MFRLVSALVLLACATPAFMVLAQEKQTPPQLDRAKPPERPWNAPERESIDPAKYQRPTTQSILTGPAETWRKALKPAAIEPADKTLKNSRVDAKWRDGKYTLKFEYKLDKNNKALAHGYSEATWNSTGKLYARGCWRDDRWHGVWEFFDQDGKPTSIQCYCEDKLDGPWAVIEDGNIQRYCVCKNGSTAGEWHYWTASGALEFRVMYEKDGKGGTHKLWERKYDAKGRLTYLWNYKQGKKHGDVVRWTDRCEVLHFDDENQTHGWQSLYDEKEGFRFADTWYEHGVHSGPYRLYDKDGSLIEYGENLEGKKRGKFMKRLADGTFEYCAVNEQGNYDGEWKQSDSSGNLVGSGKYVNGTRVGAWSRRDGANTIRCNYSDQGKLDGDDEVTAPDGTLLVRRKWNNGTPVGDWLNTLQDGSVETFAFNQSGRRQGPYKRVDKTGLVLGEGNYDQGNPVGKWTSRAGNVTTTWHHNDKGVMEGEYLSLRDDGYVVAKGRYEFGARQGEWVDTQKASALAPQGMISGDEDWQGKGSYLQDQRFGEWQYTRETGTLAALGNFKSSRREGPWKFFHADGKSLRAGGSFKNGNAQGPWERFYPDGTREAEGSYEGGGQTGEWKYYHPNGVISRQGAYKRWLAISVPAGEWKHYSENGELTRVDAYDGSSFLVQAYAERETPLTAAPEGVKLDPQLANGTFAYFRFVDPVYVLEGRAVLVNGAPAGKRQTYHPNGRLRVEGDQFGDKRQGLWKSWTPEGLPIEEVTYKDDIPEGPARQFREDGTLETEGNCKAGRKAGVWRTYYEDGTTLFSEMTFGENGKENGKATIYWRDGTVLGTGSKKEGENDGPWTYFNDDGSKEEITWKHGVEDGPYKWWYENGQLGQEGTKNGEFFVGAWSTWHANGQLKEQGSYDQSGNMTGVWKEWDETGKLIKETDHGAKK